MNTVRGGILLAMTMLAVATTTPLLAQDSDFDWSGALDRGDELAVKGISGEINVVLAEGNRAEVRAIKRGDRRDFDDVEIVAVESRYGVTVCAVYYPRGRAEERCEGDRDYGDNHGNRDIDVSVDFEIALPAGVDLAANTVVGDIEVESVRSDIRANTVSGHIWASTTGLVEANTVNGEIDIEIGTTDWRDLEFATVSGDITLTLPASTETEVRFSSISGDFESDFDVRYTRERERWVGSNIRGVIGDDDRRLAFKTVSGDVTLLRGR